MTWLRWLARLLAAILAIVGLYLAVAVAGALIPGRTTLVADSPETVDILLAAGLIHYDILLPADPETRAAFAFTAEAGVQVDASDAAWIAVGWGSTAFYTTVGAYSDISASALWTAITHDTAVIRISAYGPIADDTPKVRRVTISATAYTKLRADIIADITPAPMDLPGMPVGEAYYPASGTFDALRTCNTWVSRRLRAAGLRFGFWTPTPYAVTLSAWWFGHTA